MGEAQGTLFPLEFNRSVRVRAAGAEKLTIDGGAVLLREVGERLGLWKLMEQALKDPRHRESIIHPQLELLRTAVLTHAQGWSSQRDVGLLRDDPAFRLAVSNRRGEGPLRRDHGRAPRGALPHGGAGGSREYYGAGPGAWCWSSRSARMNSSRATSSW